MAGRGKQRPDGGMLMFNPEIHHRRSIRLRSYDYSQYGTYFVTLCVQGRECLFGSIHNDMMEANNAGTAVQDVWTGLEKRFPNATLDVFVVMPNHFHGIVLIGEVINHNVGAPLAAPALSL